MKKFLVILLSLAVLFGFAACDNSSSTPDEGQDSTVSVFNDKDIANAVAYVFTETTGFEGGIEAAVKDLLGGPGDLYSTSTWSGERDKYTVTVGTDYKTLKVEHAVSDASSEGTYPAEKATLEVTAFNTSADGTDGSTGKEYTAAFNTFTYGFESYMTNEAGNIVPVTGSVKGYFANTATAEITTDKDGVATYTVNAGSLKLVLSENPADFVLTIGGETVPEGKVFDVIAKDDVGKDMTYATFMKGLDTSKGYVDSYVKALLETDSTNKNSKLFATLAGVTTAEDISVSYDKNANGGSGSISITYTPSAAAAKLVTGTNSEVLELAKDATITIVIAGKDVASDTSFVPATATISNTKLNTSGLADADGIKYIQIDTLTVPVSVKEDGASISVTSGKPAIENLAFGTKMNGKVTSETAFGPAITQAADKTVSLVNVAVEKSYTDKI